MRWWKPRVDAESVVVARRRLAILRAELADPRLGADSGSDPDYVSGTEVFPRPEGGRESGEPEGWREKGEPEGSRESAEPDAWPEPESIPAANQSGGRHVARPAGVGRPLVERVSSRLARTASGSIGVTASHLLFVALVVVVCLALGAWMFVRARPDPVAAPRAQLSLPGRLPATVPALTPGASPGVSVGGSAAGATPTPPLTPVVVDVAGKVRQPGIVELPAGARVVDALKAAGGARPGVRLSALNLARLLVDGEQLLVGIRPAAVAPPPSTVGSAGGTPSTPAALINLNTATQEQLESLPGIGPVTSLAILTWRDENGRFSSVDELLEVSGIGDATLADIRPFVMV